MLCCVAPVVSDVSVVMLDFTSLYQPVKKHGVISGDKGLFPMVKAEMASASLIIQNTELGKTVCSVHSPEACGNMWLDVKTCFSIRFNKYIIIKI